MRRALALQKGSTVAAVLEVGLQELIASDRRLSLAEAGTAPAPPECRRLSLQHPLPTRVGTRALRSADR